MKSRTIITTSWDDGDPLDLRLAELLQVYSVPGTFYIPVLNRERPTLHAGGIREIARCFDVGGHTYHHVDLTRTDIATARSEILDGKKALEEITGQAVSVFSYPYGKYNRRIVEAVEGCGFKAARTTKLQSRFTKQLFQMGTMVNAANYCFARYPVSAIAERDADLLFFMLKNNLSFKNWDTIAMATLDFVAGHGGIWHLWGHSWEINQNNDWNKLGAVLRMVGDIDAQKADNTQLTTIVHDAKGH